MRRHGSLGDPDEFSRLPCVETEHDAKGHDLSLAFWKSEQTTHQLRVGRRIVGYGYFRQVIRGRLGHQPLSAPYVIQCRLHDPRGWGGMRFDDLPMSEGAGVPLRDGVLGHIPVTGDDEEHPEDLILRREEESFEFAIPPVPHQHPEV